MVRLAAIALVLVAIAAGTSGCALDARVDLHFTGGSPATVTESSHSVELDSHRVHGVTGYRQTVGISCSVTVVYDANDIGGPGVVVQTRRVHLQTSRVRRGTAYDFDCAGPLIFELPQDASDFHATAGQVELPIEAEVGAVPIAFGKRLRAQHGMQLVIVHRPDTLPSGDYRIELAFDLRAARPFVEKMLYAASISCGRSTYVEPLIPTVSRMERAHGVSIRPSAKAFSVNLPRIAGARENGVPVERSRKLSC